jgi:hypothetical protein
MQFANKILEAVPMAQKKLRTRTLFILLLLALHKTNFQNVRFEVFTAVIMKNGVF